MDYAVLWFVLWGFLWTAYFVAGGLDLGAGMLLYRLGKTEREKESLLKSFGPMWNGSEAWLIAAGCATFAAFPVASAVLFSAFHVPLLLILFSLILRGVALAFREKSESSSRRNACNAAILIGSAAPALLFGIFFGNLFQGLPLDGRGFSGPLRQLFTPYPLVTGMLFCLLFALHGALWVAFRTEGEPAVRAAAFALRSWIHLVIAMIVFFLASGFNASFSPDYLRHPAYLTLALLCLLALTAIRFYVKKSAFLKAFIASGMNLALLMAFGLIGLYPNLLPARPDPAFSITIFNAAAGLYTLKILTAAAAVCVPLILLYQARIYRMFRSRIPAERAG